MSEHHVTTLRNKASDEALRALERSNRSNAFLLASSRILADVTANHRDTLQRLAEYAALHFNAVCDISTVRNDEDVITPLAMYHRDPQVRRDINRAFSKFTVRKGEGMVGKVISDGKELLVLKASEDLREKTRAFSQRLVPEAFIYVPLRAGRGVLGAINVIRLEGSASFDDEELDIIRKLADHAALFLDNAWLREDQTRELELRRQTQLQLQQANETNAFLVRVSRVLSDLRADRQEVLDNLTKDISVHFGAFCVVYMMNSDGIGLRPRAFHHEREEVRMALQRVFRSPDMENGLRAARHVTRTGRPLISNDASNEFENSSIKDEFLIPKAYGFWPLMAREHIGAICLCRLKGDLPFSNVEMERCAQLATHLSLFLENMMLHDRQENEINRRKKAEEQLSRSELDLRTILDAIPINISRVTRDLHYRFVNASYMRFGISPDELVGKHISMFLGDESLERIMPRIEQVLAGEMLNYDEQVILATGKRRHFNVVIAPDRDEHGNIEGFYSCTVDITDKMEAERELKLSEERYRSLLLNSGDAFCLHRANGEILEVNSFATELLGYPREELLGMNINRIDRGWFRPEYPERLARVEPDTPITFDTEIYHRDGYAIPVEVRFVKRIEDGEVLIQALVRDRSEKHQREEMLRQSEEHLRVLISNVDDVILTIDQDGTILSVNNPKQGIVHADIIGASVYDLMTEQQSEQVAAQLKEAIANGESFEQTTRFKGPDGTTEWYMTKYCPISASDMVVAVSRNITHLKESELQHMNGITLGQEQERRRLGAELHDGVGQILSSIALELSQMRQNLSCNEDVRDRMAELSSRVNEAINEIRNISHDLMPGVLESFGLADAIREICRGTEIRTDIRFHFNPVDLLEEYPSQLEIHVYRIAQELISNTVKHAYCSNVHVNLIDHGDLLTLSVEDDGIGFDTKSPSNGIGLGNIRARVGILGGTLSVESSNTSGTLVSIELPKQT